jgi:hypothetical protein
MATILSHLAFSVIIPEQNVARNKRDQFIARLFESAHPCFNDGGTAC